ncbi:hypothetical protein K1T71_007119 [Dendrolimus kikuchii]|uniref:Uncharacterized protein n=1 Tax=Dendrolimus kikuchii TaxID=765133 RepID=A0ACC1D047_9NEOP|nr:hypothetical protein K1T71_007119 [Dendrolimus kikuchii]
MLRLCIQNACTLNTILSQPILQKQITTKLKSINTYTFALSRQYTIKITESEKSDVIYYGPLTPQIKGVKVFSLSSSVAGLLAQPIIINEAANIGSTSLIVALCSVVGFFTFVTPILLHLITKKYVIEMSYNPVTSTYKATTINFFLARKQLEFKPEDVEVPDVPGMFTTMIAKGKPLFIEARHFSDPLHYAKIMGYDKPLDFKLGETDTKKCK